MHDIEHIMKELENSEISQLRPVSLPLLSQEDMLRFVPQYEEAQALYADVRGSGIAANTSQGEVTLWKANYRAHYIFHAIKISEISGVHYLLEIKSGRFSEFTSSQRFEPTYELLEQEISKKGRRDFA